MTDLLRASSTDNFDRTLGTSRTQIVLDTSVLVADPNCLHAYADSDIVIPLIVIEELDGLKTRPDDAGRAARAALRAIEDLRNSAGGSMAAPVPVAKYKFLNPLASLFTVLKKVTLSPVVVKVLPAPFTVTAPV